MTYLGDLNNQQLRREIARRINGGHEIGHGLSNSKFYQLLCATPKYRRSDLTREEWDTIKDKLDY